MTLPSLILKRLRHKNDMTGMDPNWRGWGASDSRYAQARYLGIFWIDTNPLNHRPRGTEPEKDAEWEWKVHLNKRNERFMDDPYVPSSTWKKRWEDAITAQANGELIQYCGYNNYGGHHYWNSRWKDVNHIVDFEKEGTRRKELFEDYRPKPKGAPPFLTFNNYRIT